MESVSLDDVLAAQKPPPPQMPSGGGSGSVSINDVLQQQLGQTPPQQPETWSEYLSGMAGAVSRGVLPFGAAEQLKGVVQGGLAKVRGEDYQPAHDKAVADAEAETKQIHERHPWQAGAAQGVGAAATGLATGGALGAARGLPVAGRALGAVGDFISAAPGMQVASGAVGGAVGEGTDNPWLGLAAGAGLPIGTRMASMLLNPVTTRLTPEMMRLRDYAEQSGIRLTPGEATGSRPLQVVESTLEQLPGSSGPQGALKQQQAEQFNRASMSYSNTPGDYPTMDVLNARRADLGGQISDIAARNSLDLRAPVPAGGQANVAPRPLLDELQDINRQARLNSTSQVAGPVDKYTRELVQHIQPDGTIPGTFYRAFDTQLGTAIKDAASPDVAGGLSRLRNAVRAGFDASVGPQDAAAWQQTRREYANLMTTRDAMSGAGQQVAAGNLPPTALRGALDRSMGRGSYGAGAGDQNDLAHLGQSSLMRPPVGDSGTGIRSEAIAALTGNSLMARGALGAASALGIPRAVQAVINSDLGRHWLINGLAPGLRGQPTVPAINNIMAQRLLQANQPQR